jgi:hypothetical protein
LPQAFFASTTIPTLTIKGTSFEGMIDRMPFGQQRCARRLPPGWVMSQIAFGNIRSPVCCTIWAGLASIAGSLVAYGLGLGLAASRRDRVNGAPCIQ